MSIALFADVHGNLEALLTIKKDIESVDPDIIYFLGDIVGYGPSPVECIPIIRSLADIHLKGNHDDITVFDVDPHWEGFNPPAAGAIKWTRKMLDKHKAQGGEDYREFLKNLKEGYTDGKNILVHGSPNDPIKEYILRNKVPDISISCPEALDLVANKKKKLFSAHAHDTWVYHAGLDKPWQPVGNDSIVLPADEAAVIMIGSVGQPRDRDSRACWVLLDGDKVHFRRCKYNIDKVAEKIYRIPELDDRLGDRLKKGK